MTKKYDKFWKFHDKQLPDNAAIKSQQFRDLFQKMVANDPEERPTI